MILVTGLYIGNGLDGHAITGLGCKPVVLMVKGSCEYAVWRSATMEGDSTAQFAPRAANFAGGIKSLDADGFTVGTHATVNTPAIPYYWTAFADDGAGDMHIGSYIGDEVHGREINGLGLTPAIFWVKGENQVRSFWKTASIVGEPTMHFYVAADEPTDYIQALLADGFQVGSSTAINQIGITYHYVAFASLPGHIAEGIYIGNGLHGRLIAGLGLLPAMVWVKGTGATDGVFRPACMPDGTLIFRDLDPSGNMIQALEADGFQLGTDSAVNADGVVYRWAAWRSPPPSWEVTVALAGDLTRPARLARDSIFRAELSPED